MARDLHNIAVVNGSTLAQEDRVILGVLPQQAHGAGGGAGQAVTLAVSMPLPLTYTVQVTASQDATTWISNRTQAGFTVNIAPRLAASTLVAGAVDLVILA